MPEYAEAITFPQNSDEAIEQFGALVPTGRNALLAETVEDTTVPLDTFVSEMGGMAKFREQ